jgi:hypothetical protein
MRKDRKELHPDQLCFRVPRHVRVRLEIATRLKGMLNSEVGLRRAELQALDSNDDEVNQDIAAD